MSRVVTCAVVFVLASAGTRAGQDKLQPGAPVDRKLVPKERHEFVVTTAANQHFTIEAEQKGIDVVLTVMAPDGKAVSQADTAGEHLGTAGTERAHVVAVAPGEYRVRVEAFDRPDAKPGAYSIALRDMRALSAEEIANVQSEREILLMEEQWEKAVDTGDVAVLGRILRHDGFQTGPYAAGLRSRDQVLAEFERGAKELEQQGRTQSHTVTEHVLKAAGAIAVSTGRAIFTTASKQGSSRMSGQFVHVWAKDADGWKLVGDHFYAFGRIRKDKQPPAMPGPAVLKAYTGHFRDEHGVAIATFAVDKGELTLSWTDGGQTTPPAALAVVNDTTFSAGGDVEIVFVRSSDGQVRDVIVLNDGPAVRLVRVQSPSHTSQPSVTGRP